MKRTYSGAESGVGAIYNRERDKDIGERRMEMTEASHWSRETIRVNFINTFAAQQTGEFLLRPEGDSMRTTQAMYGSKPNISELMDWSSTSIRWSMTTSRRASPGCESGGTPGPAAAA